MSLPARSTRSARGRAAWILLIALLGVLAPGIPVAVVFETREFTSAHDEQRYRDLIAELRCLVCQNQNLADSNAALAADLRNEVHAMILEGKSDRHIIDFMVERYGDFVLYRPPVKSTTLALWGGPLVLTLAGLWMLHRALRRRSAGTALSGHERGRLECMIREAEKAHAGADDARRE